MVHNIGSELGSQSIFDESVPTLMERLEPTGDFRRWSSRSVILERPAIIRLESASSCHSTDGNGSKSNRSSKNRINSSLLVFTPRPKSNQYSRKAGVFGIAVFQP